MKSPKYTDLEEILRNIGSAVIAFSGGTDSAFLLEAARRVLGDRAAAVTLCSPLFPEEEMAEAAAFCNERGIRHFLLEANPLDLDGFAQNPENRCYLCKRYLFSVIRKTADKENIPFVLDGSNLDDLSDFRPGMQALSELGIRSPLREASLTKQEIRLLSKEMGLAGWDKPSRACLASRFVYGETITKERLAMVGQAEAYLTELGFRQVRVRIHGGTLSRIEVLPEEIGRVFELREEIANKLKECGFVYAAVDLAGFRTGSMNEGRPAHEHGYKETS